MIARHTPLQIPDHGQVVGRIVGDDVVIINFDSGLYFSLSGAGCDVWALIVTGTSLAKIVDTLEQQYEIARPVLEADITGLLNQLLDEELIMEAVQSDIGETSDQPPDVKRPYLAPRLVKYDDMAEAFAIDPPLAMAAD